MASLLSHPALPVGMYLARIFPPSKSLLYYCIVLTILPDADAIGFKLGVPYASPWGHRGFTHSIVFALLIGLILSFFHRKFETSRLQTFLWCFLSTLSHPIFDAFTNGGLGVALLWPFSFERYFAPIRPVAVSPIGIISFFSLRGVVVVLSEILWIWLPMLSLSYLLRRATRPNLPTK